MFAAAELVQTCSTKSVYGPMPNLTNFVCSKLRQKNLRNFRGQFAKLQLEIQFDFWNPRRLSKLSVILSVFELIQTVFK